MGWAQIRQAVREQVHVAFALSGRYFAVLEGVGVRVSVRVHSKLANVGDLQGGGYARSIEGLEVCVFRSTDVERLGIKSGGIIKLDDGRIYRLRTKNDVIDDYTTEYTATSL
jgi:hypothetical protein